MTENFIITVTFTQDEKEAQLAYKKAVRVILSSDEASNNSYK